MDKFGVIDVGSNSVRLVFVAGGKVLYKALQTTRLGEGLADTGRLCEGAIARSAAAVDDFYRQACCEGAEMVLVFATAAVRSAENGKEFIDRVKALCGLEVEVISGETEAEIGILGALGEKDGAIIDIGGASTEIVVKKNGAFVYKKSVDIGVVRLKDLCGREKSALEDAAKKAANAFGEVPLQDATLYAIGGTATTLAAQQLGLTVYDSGKITGTEITATQMQSLADKLLNMTVEEIAKLPCMPTGRADVLTGGAVLLAFLMRAFKVEKIVVSDRDNLEGYAIKKGLMK